MTSFAKAGCGIRVRAVARHHLPPCNGHHRTCSTTPTGRHCEMHPLPIIGPITGVRGSFAGSPASCWTPPHHSYAHMSLGDQWGGSSFALPPPKHSVFNAHYTPHQLCTHTPCPHPEHNVTINMNTQNNNKYAGI